MSFRNSLGWGLSTVNIRPAGPAGTTGQVSPLRAADPIPYGWYMQPVGSTAGLASVESIEQELTLLVRRAQKVHLRGAPAAQVVERAAYGILA